MKKKITIFLTFLILGGLLLSPSLGFAKKKLPPPDYFPLKVGYWWKYKNVDKGWVMTIKVTAKEKIGDKNCYKLETIAANGKVMLIDYYYKVPGKVYWVKQKYAASKMEVIFKPIREFLHNPLIIGDKWTWKGKGMMDVDIEDYKNVEKTVKIKVPAGNFSTREVDSKNIQGGAETKKMYWYAPNVGLVKSYTENSSMKSTLVLIKYNLKGK